MMRFLWRHRKSIGLSLLTELWCDERKNRMSQNTYRKTRNMDIRKNGRQFEAVLATETEVDRGDYVEVLSITRYCLSSVQEISND